MDAVRRYLAEIGRRGGRKSRRALDHATARDMVRVREARRAFRRFRTTCFWSYRPDREIRIADVPWVAEQLRKHGNREAWNLAARLSPVHDTRPDAERVRLAAIRRMEPARRLREALDLSETVRSLALGRWRAIHPHRTDLELAELMLGRALVPGGPVGHA
jgi:hypothetical protein